MVNLNIGKKEDESIILAETPIPTPEIGATKIADAPIKPSLDIGEEDLEKTEGGVITAPLPPVGVTKGPLGESPPTAPTADIIPIPIGDGEFSDVFNFKETITPIGEKGEFSNIFDFGPSDQFAVDYNSDIAEGVNEGFIPERVQNFYRARSVLELQSDGQRNPFNLFNPLGATPFSALSFEDALSTKINSLDSAIEQYESLVIKQETLQNEFGGPVDLYGAGPVRAVVENYFATGPISPEGKAKLLQLHFPDYLDIRVSESYPGEIYIKRTPNEPYMPLNPVGIGAADAGAIGQAFTTKEFQLETAGAIAATATAGAFLIPSLVFVAGAAGAFYGAKFGREIDIDELAELDVETLTDLQKKSEISDAGLFAIAGEGIGAVFTKLAKIAFGARRTVTGTNLSDAVASAQRLGLEDATRRRGGLPTFLGKSIWHMMSGKGIEPNYSVSTADVSIALATASEQLIGTGRKAKDVSIKRLANFYDLHNKQIERGLLSEGVDVKDLSAIELDTAFLSFQKSYLDMFEKGVANKTLEEAGARAGQVRDKLSQILQEVVSRRFTKLRKLDPTNSAVFSADSLLSGLDDIAKPRAARSFTAELKDAGVVDEFGDAVLTEVIVGKNITATEPLSSELASLIKDIQNSATKVEVASKAGIDVGTLPAEAKSVIIPAKGSTVAEVAEDWLKRANKILFPEGPERTFGDRRAGQVKELIYRMLEDSSNTSPQYKAALKTTNKVSKLKFNIVNDRVLVNLANLTPSERVGAATAFFNTSNRKAISWMKLVSTKEEWKEISDGLKRNILRDKLTINKRLDDLVTGDGDVEKFVNTKVLRQLMTIKEEKVFRVIGELAEKENTPFFKIVRNKVLTFGKRTRQIVSKGTTAEIQELIDVSGGINSPTARKLSYGIFTSLMDDAKIISANGALTVDPERWLSSVLELSNLTRKTRIELFMTIADRQALVDVHNIIVSFASKGQGSSLAVGAQIGTGLAGITDITAGVVTVNSSHIAQGFSKIFGLALRMMQSDKIYTILNSKELRDVFLTIPADLPFSQVLQRLTILNIQATRIANREQEPNANDAAVAEVLGINNNNNNNPTKEKQ